MGEEVKLSGCFHWRDTLDVVAGHCAAPGSRAVSVSGLPLQHQACRHMPSIMFQAVSAMNQYHNEHSSTRSHHG